MNNSRLIFGLMNYLFQQENFDKFKKYIGLFISFEFTAVLWTFGFQSIFLIYQVFLKHKIKNISTPSVRIGLRSLSNKMHRYHTVWGQNVSINC